MERRPPRKEIGNEIREHSSPAIMEDGKYYDLNPPAHPTSGIYHRVRCEWRFPPLTGRPDTYMVAGIAEGKTEEHQFPLEMKPDGVALTPAPQDNFTLTIAAAKKLPN